VQTLVDDFVDEHIAIYSNMVVPYELYELYSAKKFGNFIEL